LDPEVAPVTGALGFAQAVSNKAVEIARMVQEVFMVVLFE